MFCCLLFYSTEKSYAWKSPYGLIGFAVRSNSMYSPFGSGSMGVTANPKSGRVVMLKAPNCMRT